MSAYLQPSHSKERWWNSNASIFPCFLLSFFPPLFHSFLFFLSFCNSLFLHIINNYLVFPSSSCSSFFVNIFPFYLTFLLLISFFNSFCSAIVMKRKELFQISKASEGPSDYHPSCGLTSGSSLADNDELAQKECSRMMTTDIFL